MKIFKNRFVRFAVFLTAFVCAWNLVCWLIALFTKDEYFFEPVTGLALPAVAAAVLGYRFISVKDRNNCKEDIDIR